MHHPKTRRTPLPILLLPVVALILGVPLLLYLTGGFFGYFLGVIACLLLLGLIHWLLWCRSLTEEVVDEREEEALDRKVHTTSAPYGIRKE